MYSNDVSYLGCWHTNSFIIFKISSVQSHIAATMTKDLCSSFLFLSWCYDIFSHNYWSSNDSVFSTGFCSYNISSYLVLYQNAFVISQSQHVSLKHTWTHTAAKSIHTAWLITVTGRSTFMWPSVLCIMLVLMLVTQWRHPFVCRLPL